MNTYIIYLDTKNYNFCVSIVALLNAFNVPFSAQQKLDRGRSVFVIAYVGNKSIKELKQEYAKCPK